MNKNGVFGADFEVINTRFYVKHWEVLSKNVFHSTHIYIQIFILFPKLLCIMKHYCDINESGFKFRFYSLFWRGPPENFEKITSKWCILSAFWGFKKSKWTFL